MAEGIPYHAIAKQLGVALRTVERWGTRPDIKQAVKDVQAKAVESLADAIFEKCRDAVSKSLPKAVRRIAEALDHPDARIQIRAADAIARWSGFYQPNKPTTSEQQGNAEQNLQGYLSYLESNNANGSQHKSVR